MKARDKAVSEKLLNLSYILGEGRFLLKRIDGYPEVTFDEFIKHWNSINEILDELLLIYDEMGEYCHIFREIERGILNLSYYIEDKSSSFIIGILYAKLKLINSRDISEESEIFRLISPGMEYNVKLLRIFILISAFETRTSRNNLDISRIRRLIKIHKRYSLIKLYLKDIEALGKKGHFSHIKLKVKLMFLWLESKIKRPLGEEVFVLRNMGGLGDILMMVPAIRIFRKKFVGKHLKFFIPKSYISLLSILTDLDVRPIETCATSIDHKNVINWSDCPAARYEYRNIPNVNTGRPEIYAASLGLDGEEIREEISINFINKVPDYTRMEALKIRAALTDQDKPIIGLQPYSRDQYKSCAQLVTYIQQSNIDAKFLVFHEHDIEIPQDARFHGVFSLPLEDMLPYLEACDYFIAVDSGLMHLAASLSKPVLCVVGPTGGEPQLRHFSKKVIMRNSSYLHCSPCWRNEESECLVSCSRDSVCLSRLPKSEFLSSIEVLLSTYPIHQSQL